jgi:hypothetical protein
MVGRFFPVEFESDDIEGASSEMIGQDISRKRLIVNPQFRFFVEQMTRLVQSTGLDPLESSGEFCSSSPGGLVIRQAVSMNTIVSRP